MYFDARKASNFSERRERVEASAVRIRSARLDLERIGTLNQSPIEICAVRSGEAVQRRELAPGVILKPYRTPHRNPRRRSSRRRRLFRRGRRSRPALSPHRVGSIAAGEAVQRREDSICGDLEHSPIAGI